MNDEPPHDVLAERLQKAIRGRTVSAAVFTTFRFDPAFFEQEVLTALFDLPWHHVPKIRALQFEEILRPLSGKLAVYYDQRALVEGDLGSPVLDVRRIPCRPRYGYFHPKTVFVLVEDEDGRSLVTMTSSANLTRAGWWENVEAAAVVEIPEWSRSRMTEDLITFTRHLRDSTSDVGEHGALDEVRRFLRNVTQSMQRSSGGSLHPHFYANGQGSARGVADFIADATRGAVEGWNLEVISPYVDDADVSRPLVELVQQLRPRDVRVLVPEDSGGARCREALYADVETRGWTWGRLEEEPKRGVERASAPRTVHAKVYRFFRGKREIIFVGSVNLTTAGHQAAGNVEAGILLERRHRQSQRHWLLPVGEPPAFLPPVEEEVGVEDHAHRLVLRYDWSIRELAGLWPLTKPSPPLSVTAHGVDLFAIEAAALPPKEWHVLEDVDASRFEDHLRSSSFLTVVDEDGSGGALLVLEVGMAHRPSLLLELTPAEILQYWALLTDDQRVEYLARHGEALLDLEGGEALVTAPVVETPSESMFDRFAGMFHGFASLERKIVSALEDHGDAEAEFLVFGQKPDSLRRLVDRVVEKTVEQTRVDDYLLLLCAQQLVDRVKREWPSFWSVTSGADALQAALLARGDIRQALVDANDAEMGAFLAWHERKFLRPVKKLAP